MSWHFGDLRLETPKVASRCAQEAPKKPQDDSKRLQEGPKRPQETPRRAQGGLKTASRRPQVASKSPPSRVQVAFKNKLLSRKLPRGAQEAPRAPKKPPRSLQELP